MISPKGCVLQSFFVGCLLRACSVLARTATEVVGECPADEEVSQTALPVVLLQTRLEARVAVVHDSALAKKSGLDGTTLSTVLLVVLIWLVIGFAFASCVFSSYSVSVADSKLSSRKTTSERQTSPQSSGHAWQHWYFNFFYANKNKEFGRRSEHAFRGAFMFGIYALPFFIPPPWRPTVLQNFIESGVYSSFIGQQILFNYQRTVGETIISGWQTACGTLLAFLTIFTLFGFFPTGVANDTTGHVYVIGVLSGSALVLSMLWLNFPVKVTIFCLARFSEYWMEFLNPDPLAAAQYSVGFQINWNGTAMKAFMATVVGGFLALTANMFPYPELSLSLAEEDCCEAIALLKNSWLMFFDFMKQPRKREDMLNMMQRELFQITAHIDDCNNRITSTWWETFGIKWRKRKRLLIAELNNSNRKMQSQLLGAVQCVMADEAFAEKHVEFIHRVQEEIEPLIVSVGETMYWTAKSLHLTTPAGELHRSIQKTRSKIDSVTKAFHGAKAALAIPNVDDDFLEDHVFCRSLCIFGRISCDTAVSFLEYEEGRALEIEKSIYNGPDIFSVFSLKAISQLSHIKFAARQTVSYFFVFLCGYFGLRDELFSRYNYTLPVTLALLISHGTGIQLKKNLMRLEGVVLGTAVGTLFHIFVDQCSIWNCLIAITITTVWIWLMLLGHFSGQEHAYLCFLLALFGQNQLVKPCSPDGSQDAINLTESVFTVVTTIMIMTVVDAVLPTRPGSHFATEALETAWTDMTDTFQHLFDPESHVQNYVLAEARLSVAILEARSLEMVAAEEPRLWKTPWRHKSFAECLKSLRLLRATMYSVGDSLSRRGLQEYPSDKAFKAILKMPQMQALMKIVLEEIEFQKELNQVFLHEVSTTCEKLAAATQQQIDDFRLHKGAVALASRVSLQDIPPDPSQSLEFDCAANVSHIISCFYSMRNVMMHLKGIIVFNG